MKRRAKPFIAINAARAAWLQDFGWPPPSGEGTLIGWVSLGEAAAAALLKLGGGAA